MNKIKEIKRVISFSLITSMALTFGYMSFEPEMVEAVTGNVTVTQPVSQEISIDTPGNVSMSPSIPGMTGNLGSPATGSVTWNVKTSNSAGFNMGIEASQTNALSLDSTYYFADYSATSPELWSSPGSGVAEFGFAVDSETPADTVAVFNDDGSTCGSGTTGSGICWDGFDGATSILVISRSTNTDSTGEDEMIKFQAESNAKFLESGNYTATVTVTATMN